MAKRGRKVTVYTPERIKEIKEKLDMYTEKTPIPIIAEFCYQNNIRKQRLYELEDLADSIKRAIEKKESQLEKLALTGKINTTFAIFSLKQLGWSDKQKIDMNTDNNINVKIEFVGKDGRKNKGK